MTAPRQQETNLSSSGTVRNSSTASRRRRGFRLKVLFFILLAVSSWVFYIGMRRLNRLLFPEDFSPSPFIQPISGNADILQDDALTTQEDPFWNLRLVNNENAIPEDIRMTLVEIPGGEQVDARIFHPLMEMLDAARSANWGIPPRVVSGYRTAETQEKFYQDKVQEYLNQGSSLEQAQEEARLLVALSGHSEHQLGLAVDINGATYDLYSWLQENSYQYGFIFRYPGDKTEITGISEEVWHYRYVGVEAATEMYQQGLCLEEYLAQNPAV